jgi:hypothetical protein
MSTHDHIQFTQTDIEYCFYQGCARFKPRGESDKITCSKPTRIISVAPPMRVDKSGEASPPPNIMGAFGPALLLTRP